MPDPSRPATGHPTPPPYHHPTAGQTLTPAIADPYAAPSPRPQQCNHPDPRPNYAARSFFGAFFFALGVVAIVTLMIVIITSVVIRPGVPVFGIDSLSVTNLSANSSILSGTWHVGFFVRTRQNIAVSYDELRVSLYYKGEYLSEAKLPPFKQGKKSETILNVTFSDLDANVHPRAAYVLNTERATGLTGFDVQIVASTSFQFRKRSFKFLCRNVPVRMEGNLTGGGGGSDCQVWT